MEERLCLQWNDFQDNIQRAFWDMREDKYLTDVTLACKDGQQVEAHKVVLASSSPFFQKLFARNRQAHPLIYMGGVKSSNVLAILDFLYRGEANVYEENLAAFLGLAEELRLKGLTGSSTKGDGDFKSKDIAPENKIGEVKCKKETISHTPMSFSRYNSNSPTESTSVALVSEEAHQLDEQIKSMMTEKELIPGRSYKTYACNVCGKEDKISNIKTHIEANHVASNISHSCDICGKISRSRHGLRLHKAREH